MYSRNGYLAVRVQSAEGTPLKPNTFVPLMSEDLMTEFEPTKAMPIVGNRAMNIRSIPKAIPAPSGNFEIQAEPKTFGHFLRGIYGAVSTGRYMPVTSMSADFTVGETITGGTSSQTATVVASSSEGDYLLVSSPSGAFTNGETLTGGTSGSTAVLTRYDASVYGHEFVAPQNSLPFYTVEIGMLDFAYRYYDAQFSELASLGQDDNIVTASVAVMSKKMFRHAKITAITTAGAGAKTITVDQTSGLINADVCKIYRPGVGFLDFASAGVKTHSITVASELTVSVTNLETATAVGDLLVLAPQTASYTVDREFSFIGGTEININDTIALAIAGSGNCVEDFEYSIKNEIEPRHCANATNLIDRFPGKMFLKGLTAEGKINKTYVDETLYAKLRLNTPQGLQVVHTAQQIATTGFYYTMDTRFPTLQFKNFNTPLSSDDLVEQEIPYDVDYSATDGYFAKTLLVNDVTAY